MLFALFFCFMFHWRGFKKIFIHVYPTWILWSNNNNGQKNNHNLLSVLIL
jgi:hypothetical protein